MARELILNIITTNTEIVIIWGDISTIVVIISQYIYVCVCVYHILSCVHLKLTSVLCKFAVAVQSLRTVWLCNPMDYSMPGFPVLHHLPELAQIHIHWLGDTIQPSHPLTSPSLPAFSLSQHQGLFQWVGSSHQVAKVLELLLQMITYLPT